MRPFELRSPGSLCLVAMLVAGGCRSDGPWVETDPDAFVAAGPGDPWTPADARARDESRVLAEDADESNPGRVGPLAAMETRTRPLPAGPGGGAGRDVSLLHLVEFALTNRPETRIAWERSRVAAAELGIAKGAWYPVLGLSADFYYNRVLFPATGQALQVEALNLLPQLGLNYVLFDFGRREADDDAARAALLAANLQANRVLQSTVHDVQVTYFRLDAALAAREAAERNVELAETVTEMVESQMLVGLATAPDLYLARQDLAQARFDLQATVAVIQTARAALLDACGVPATTPVSIARVRDDQLPAALAYRVEDVIDVSLVGRPDLAAAVADVRNAVAEEARAEAEFMPTVQVLGDVGYAWARFKTSVNDPPLQYPSDTDGIPVWNVGIGGTWTIFEGFIRENAVRAARARRREAEATLEKLRLQAIGETWDAYFRVQAFRKQFDFGLALVAQSEEAFAAVSASYRQGLSTITELVQAERDLQEARATFVTTRSDLLVAAADLSFAAGEEIGRYPNRAAVRAD